jgi:hypothetical protein
MGKVMELQPWLTIAAETAGISKTQDKDDWIETSNHEARSVNSPASMCGASPHCSLLVPPGEQAIGSARHGKLSRGTTSGVRR